MKGLKTYLSGLALATWLAFTPMQSIQAQEKSKIIFTEYNGDRPEKEQTKLWIVNPNGSELKKLSDSVGNTNDGASKAVFSPDGNMIAFKNSDDKYEIIDLKGNVIYSVENRYGSNEDIAWTPDGEAILFRGNLGGIFEFDLERNYLSRFKYTTDTTGANYYINPVMSPDHRKVLLTGRSLKNDCYTNYVLNATGIHIITNTFCTSYRNETLNLAWIDDSHILFRVITGEKEGSNTIIQYDNIYSGKAKTHFINSQFESMVVSQDKKSIALVQGFEPLERKLTIINAKDLDSDTLRITETNIAGQSVMAYSSDSKIFCLSPKNEHHKDENHGIFAFDENLNRHVVIYTPGSEGQSYSSSSMFANYKSEIGIITSIDWNSKPVKTSDLGFIDVKAADFKKNSLEVIINK